MKLYKKSRINEVMRILIIELPVDLYLKVSPCAVYVAYQNNWYKESFLLDLLASVKLTLSCRRNYFPLSHQAHRVLYLVVFVSPWEIDNVY